MWCFFLGMVFSCGHGYLIGVWCFLSMVFALRYGFRYVICVKGLHFIINPWLACTVRVSVLVMCVCL